MTLLLYAPQSGNLAFVRLSLSAVNELSISYFYISSLLYILPDSGPNN